MSRFTATQQKVKILQTNLSIRKRRIQLKNFELLKGTDLLKDFELFEYFEQL